MTAAAGCRKLTWRQQWQQRRQWQQQQQQWQQRRQDACWRRMTLWLGKVAAAQKLIDDLLYHNRLAAEWESVHRFQQHQAEALRRYGHYIERAP